MKEADWIKNSKRIKDLEVEICFKLYESFYTGDPNNFKQIQDEQFKEPLALPVFDRVVDTLAKTREVITYEDELAGYYKRIAERAGSLGKHFNEISHYFWLRLWFWNTAEDVHIDFPWYDTLSEMRQLFDCIRKGAEHDAYGDMDQGWQIDVLRSGDFLHIRRGYPGEDEEYLNVAVPYEPFAKAVSEVDARATAIIEHLTQSLGTDVWTRRAQEAEFGTPRWRPR